MHYDPALDNHGLAINPFKACVGPRPIGWISTVSINGIDNLAPFSQFNNLGFDPPYIMFSAAVNSEFKRKDSVVNAEDMGQFVYNLVPYDLREKMNLTAATTGPEVDEFEVAGLTKADSIKVKPKRVAESPVQLECELVQTIRLPGNSSAGACDLVIGKVVMIHIKDEYIMPDGKLDVLKIRTLARLGYADYTTVQEVFSMHVGNTQSVPGSCGWMNMEPLGKKE